MFEDLDGLYAELGNASAVFTRSAGGSIGPVAGVYDASYVEVAVGRVGVESVQPIFTCAAVDVSGAGGVLSVCDGDRVQIGSSTYEITAAKPDGEGSVSFDMQEVTI